MNAQKVYTRGDHKAVLTRLGPRKWYVALGYAGEVEMTYGRSRSSTRRLAMMFVNDWLADARMQS